MLICISRPSGEEGLKLKLEGKRHWRTGSCELEGGCRRKGNQSFLSRCFSVGRRAANAMFKLFRYPVV